MLHPHRRTSIPIHFSFASSKRLSVPPQDPPQPTRPAPFRPKRRPSPIEIPQSTPGQTLPTVVPVEWTPVEISNFAPHLRLADLEDLLKDFDVSKNFAFPATPRFTHPFRTTILVAGLEEARKVVRELNKTTVGGRIISVEMVAKVDQEGRDRRDALAADVADELKIAIINTARVYFPGLSDGFLEVRELVKDGSCFAFLQKRKPVTIHSDPEVQALLAQKWEFVAGVAVDIEDEEEKGLSRLAALRDLQEHLETQGVLGKIWEKRDGSLPLVGNSVRGAVAEELDTVVCDW